MIDLPDSIEGEEGRKALKVAAGQKVKGKKLTANGGFLAPDLSYDGKEILFAWTEISDNEGGRLRYRKWTENNTYKIFRVNVDGSALTQLTDGIWNDFDPCFLPSGRIMFISERDTNLSTGQFDYYVMNADGTNQTRLTFNDAFDSGPACWSPF